MEWRVDGVASSPAFGVSEEQYIVLFDVLESSSFAALLGPTRLLNGSYYSIG
jgi:hypothetical protein